MTDATRPKVLITGGAGFIGFHLAKRLLADGWLVTGVDGITPYYDVALKHRRLSVLKKSNAFNFREFMLEDMDAVREAFEETQPDVVVHLAAQAGVRYSLEHPRSYVDSNIVGTFNVMEMVRELRPRHFLLASTSSIYGANTEMPFAETHRADHPVTIYAATKKATEMMAHSYAHLHELPTTAFRFFTVYGPWGRPDMTPFKFVDLVMAGKPIDVYGEGDMRRDFTYIDDLIEGVVRLIDAVPVVGEPVEGATDSLAPTAPFRVVNVGGGKPAGLMEFIDCLEKHLDRPIQRNMLPMQQGDVRETFASADLLEALTGYRPATSVDEGIKAFVDWYQTEYLPGRA